MKKKETSAARALEGEGSYTATRAYNSKLRAFADSADIPGLAARARKALSGPEGATLKRAEERGKRGKAARGKARS
jgi:hypothetical protein